MFRTSMTILFTEMRNNGCFKIYGMLRPSVTYVPQDWPEHQRINVLRAISDLEKYCQNLSEERQHEVYKNIERLKSALRGDDLETWS
jgi:hypothetical protein